MNYASCILTYRESDSPDRRANLHAVLAWLACLSQLEVIVVEQDSLPRLGAALAHPACRNVFAYNPGPFNKGWGFNIGYRFARGNVLIFADADVLIDKQLPVSAELCQRGYQVVKPYRAIVDLTPAETAIVRDGSFDYQPDRPDDAATNREGIAEFVVLCGGIFCLRREAFVALGGWDERFLGWGGEDDAMTYKLQRLRLSTIELDEGPALHLWHPRSSATTMGQPMYANNCALLADYRQRSDAELQRFAEVQMQVIGNREKYRPRL